MSPKALLAMVLGALGLGAVVWLAAPAPAPKVTIVMPAPAAPAMEEPATQVATPVAEPVVPPPVSRPAVPAAPVKAKKAGVTMPAPAPQPMEMPSPSQPAQPAEKAEARPPAPVPAAQPAVRTEAARIAHEPEPAPAPARKPETVTIPAGTLLTVRLRDGLSAASAQDGTNFSATLDHPLIINGMVVAERGTVQRGRVVDVAKSGRVKGRSYMALELIELNTSDGQKVDIHTETYRKEEESGLKKDATRAGIAAGIGAAIGAIAGGGKGAAIGAGVGGAAGAGGAIITRGKDVVLPSETRLTFRLSEPVTLTEKID
jgi:hypothetical protein